MIDTAKEALDEIKEAESKVAKTLEDTKKEARHIIEEAKTKGALLIKEAQTNAKREAQAIDLAVKEDAAKEVNRIEKECMAEIEAFKAKAEKNIEKGVDFLKKKLKI